MLQADHIQLLAKSWLDARGDQLMPKASQLGPFQMRPFLPNIAMYRMTPEGRYKVTLQGTGLVEAFGFDATGMFLDDVYPDDVFVELNAFYELLFNNHYISHSVRVYERKGTGALVTIEQLMVPLSDENGVHDRYVLLAYNVPLPQRPRSDPNRTIALGSLEERTVYHPVTMLPVDCFATTARSDEQMQQKLTAFLTH